MFDLNKEKALLEWLEQVVGHEKFLGGEERLARMLPESLKLELRQQGLKIVTVGGTNGKGETVYSLSHLMQRQGIPHAVFISPHVLSVRERMSCNGELISYEELREVLDLALAKARAMGFSLSFFEAMLCAFVSYVQRRLRSKENEEGASEASLQYMILEVGLGGRLDGTNHFDPMLTAITSIGRDHQELLGQTYRAILGEKMGIQRQKVPMVTSLETAYLRGEAKKMRIEGGEEHDLFAEGFLKRSDAFDRRNHVLATYLFYYCQYQIFPNRDQLESFLAPIIFPHFKGRQEEMVLGKTRYLFFGSHNLDGIRKLRDLVQEKEREKVKDKSPSSRAFCDHVLTSFSTGRNWAEVTRILALLVQMVPEPGSLFVTQFDHFKARTFSEHEKAQIRQLGIRWVEDWPSFLKGWKVEANTFLVTGSFYFVGEVQTFLLSNDATSVSNPHSL